MLYDLTDTVEKLAVAFHELDENSAISVILTVIDHTYLLSLSQRGVHRGSERYSCR
jgi:hypothetical protein